MSDTVDVEAARIPDRDRLLQELRRPASRRAQSARSSIEVPQADPTTGEVYAQVEGMIMSLGAPFVPIKHEGSIYVRPAGSASGALERRRLALADADAERREAVAAAAAAQLVQQRDDEPRAAHPERMAERDRAAVHVHLLGVEAELPDHDEALRGERLVQLDQVEVSDVDPARARAASAPRAPGRCP